MTRFRGSTFLLLFALAPAAFFITTLIGTARSFSPVPYYDMWETYVHFYVRILDGQWRALVAQANEHQIIFAKLFFLADFRFFGGLSYLLVATNIAAMIALWITLSAAAKRLLKDHPDLWIIVSCAMAPLCFSWMQESNIAWGNQIAFFSAYLFPLLAFTSLAMSMQPQRATAWFCAALLCGVISVGTMANGLAVMPLMLVMLMAMPHRSGRRIAAVLFLGAAAIVAWFSTTALWVYKPTPLADLAGFVLSFLGLPFANVFHDDVATRVAGVFFIAASVFIAVQWWRRGQAREPLVAALLAFLLYIGASAVAVARARFDPGGHTAAAERYATGLLVGWSVLIILFAYQFKHLRYAHTVYGIAALLVIAALVPTQLFAFHKRGPGTAQLKMQGAVSLRLGVKDNAIESFLYGNVGNLRTYAAEAMERNLTIFAEPAFARATALVGASSLQGFHTCRGEIDRIESLGEGEDYRRITGWVFDERTKRVPAFVHFVAGDEIVGVAPTGQAHTHIARLVDRRARYGGFIGYVKAAAGPPAIVCAD